MAELRISNLETGFVLYFETRQPRINAYALASTLVALADAAKAAGRTLNSAVDIEIVVEALDSGSFKAKISAIARQSGLFATQQIASLIIGVLGAYIYDHTLAKREPVQIEIRTDEVIVTSGNDRVIVPRQVYEATQSVSRNPVFVRSIDRMLAGAAMDEQVTGFGLSPAIDVRPTLILPRELLAIRDESLDTDSKTRVIEEDGDLYIVKALLVRSKRMWGFKWHGVNISAPIKDPNFYDDFAKHNFTIAPGDEFQARLAIHQVKDDVSGIYTNKSYEVVSVYRHIPHPKPQNLPLE